MITDHFKRFGLTVHRGDKEKKKKSKTEILYIPPAQADSEPSTETTADVMLNENEYFSFCEVFKYLGTTFDAKLDDSTEVKKRIGKAVSLFFAHRRLFTDRDLSIKLRTKLYEALVLETLLFGCESWALKVADRKKLEAQHHRFLRKMLNITIYQVKENRIKNEEVRRKCGGSQTLAQTMELKRARWLEKIAKMPETRGPRKLFLAWTSDPRPKQRPSQSLRHSYAYTLHKELKITDKEASLTGWMTLAARHPKLWAKQVELGLGLKKGAYKIRKPSNTRC